MKSTDNYIRDPQNKGAVLNIDNAALKAYKLQKNKFKEVNRLKNDLNEINNIKNEVQDIKSEIKELKNMIHLLFDKMKG